MHVDHLHTIKTLIDVSNRSVTSYFLFPDSSRGLIYWITVMYTVYWTWSRYLFCKKMSQSLSSKWLTIFNSQNCLARLFSQTPCIRTNARWHASINCVSSYMMPQWLSRLQKLLILLQLFCAFFSVSDAWNGNGALVLCDISILRAS